MNIQSMGRMNGLLAVSAVALLLIATGTANAAMWSNEQGSNARFAWSGGQNSNGHHGNPLITEAGFFFNQTSNFRASGGGGLADSVTDIAQVNVDVSAVAQPGFTTFLVQEWGVWSAGVSDPSDFTLQADISVFRFLPSPHFEQVDMSDIGLVFNQDGTWSAEGMITAPSGDWVQGQYKVNNTLQVSGDAPAGSFIEKTGMMVTLPEPASITLLLGGCAVLLGRRRGARR